MRRSWFVVAGLLFAALWLACQMITVLPGSSAETVRWAVGNALAAFGGAALGAAAVLHRRGP